MPTTIASAYTSIHVACTATNHANVYANATNDNHPTSINNATEYAIASSGIGHGQ